MTAPGKATRALVEFVDAYPSVCELAGLSPPAPLKGKSFVPPAEQSRTTVEAKFKQEHGVRYTAWLDRRAPRNEPLAQELSDHETDPHETKNAAKANAEIVRTLSAQLRARLK